MESQKWNFYKMLSILPTKLTKESSTAKILQFSVITQVQERLPPQSNQSHEQSTLKLLISWFNKKLPKKESKFTMWTLKIKLLISLPKVLGGNCVKNWSKDLEWYHQRTCDLSFPFSAWLIQNRSAYGYSILRVQNLNVGFLKDRMYWDCQSGLRIWSCRGFWREAPSRLWRRCIIYITEVLYSVLNRSSVRSICDRPNPRNITASIISKTQSKLITSQKHNWDHYPEA